MNPLFKKHELQFIAWFSGIFLFTVAVLSASGLMPNEFKEKSSEDIGLFEQMRLKMLGVDYWVSPTVEGAPSSSTTVASSDSTTERIAAENPVQIEIPIIGLTSTIRNPVSVSTDILDEELKRGVVRYPGSGYPGSGNMFMFGHSTSYSIVQNQAYKVFNHLKELSIGDQILVHSATHTYAYKVTAVNKVDKNDTWVTFEGGKDRLTLSTCDSFGKKSDRYVVEADYIGIVSVK